MPCESSYSVSDSLLSIVVQQGEWINERKINFVNQGLYFRQNSIMILRGQKLCCLYINGAVLPNPLRAMLST
ncbi:hypothetical protein XELAEV_18015158mg [Xenopus laevis]|uniref:Uncharacterized protein n=1 Tax=Xenopus laevis TaxID=8355 RepID=A0A974HW35_XENLA|nr:hypothetical protein XELAEV_18015158mg [Xenopus laevis]